MSCEHVSLELRPKTSETNDGRLFQTVGAHHENRRAAILVDEDCVGSRPDVDNLRTSSIDSKMFAVPQYST